VATIARVVARRLPPHVDRDDLISAGYLGLIEAAQSYDPARGKSFETFASYRIRGAMLDDIRTRDPLSRDMRTQSNQIAHATRGLELQLGRVPDQQEIAGRLGIDVETLHVRRQTMIASAVLGIDDAGPNLLDHIGDRRAVDPLGRALWREEIAGLAARIEALPERMQRVLTSYYFEDLSLKQIGAAMGVTESRICQIHREAIGRLRGI
jgi:RNA polymerase sigma factor FliA